LLVVVLLVLGLAGCLAYQLSRGSSARAQPSAIEETLARRFRHLAVPRKDRDAKNPVPLTPEVLKEARAHFADHCAICHGNDGRGQTEIGQNLYPKAPDMLKPETQSMTDGELFYVIHNGIRLTGMPAWGDGPPEKDLESWHLVHFVRALPTLHQAQLEEMEALNPRGPGEAAEEQEIEKFLEGGKAHSPEPHKHSHGH
jgi:cytochrome c553